MADLSLTHKLRHSPESIDWEIVVFSIGFQYTSHRIYRTLILIELIQIMKRRLIRYHFIGGSKINSHSQAKTPATPEVVDKIEDRIC